MTDAPSYAFFLETQQSSPPSKLTVRPRYESLEVGDGCTVLSNVIIGAVGGLVLAVCLMIYRWNSLQCSRQSLPLEAPKAPETLGLRFDILEASTFSTP